MEHSERGSGCPPAPCPLSLCFELSLCNVIDSAAECNIAVPFTDLYPPCIVALAGTHGRTLSQSGALQAACRGGLVWQLAALHAPAECFGCISNLASGSVTLVVLLTLTSSTLVSCLCLCIKIQLVPKPSVNPAVCTTSVTCSTQGSTA